MKMADATRTQKADERPKTTLSVRVLRPCFGAYMAEVRTQRADARQKAGGSSSALCDGPTADIFLWIRPLPDGVPWPSRVKRALKVLLRSYGLKARAWADPKDLPPHYREIEAEPDGRTPQAPT